MTTQTTQKPKFAIKTPGKLSERIQWLRDYYFRGVNRCWNNEYTAWTTGTPWDFQYEELSFYIVPETYAFFQTFRSSFRQVAKPVTLHPDFWDWSLPERKAWFNHEVMVHYLPKEILPGDLIAGARFNVMTSCCLTKKEARQYEKLVLGKDGARETTLWFHNHGYGNTGATSGHLVPDYQRIIDKGWKDIHEEIEERYKALSNKEQHGAKGAQLRAMKTASKLALNLATEYADLCRLMAEEEADPDRKEELLKMSKILHIVPWEPAQTFWQALQSLWITHMLIMSDENYPGPGVSFGRIDQYLYPLWQKSLDEGMNREFGKELLLSLIHI